MTKFFLKIFKYTFSKEARRRLEMAVAEMTSTASQLTKIGKIQSAGCQLCRRAREARGESTDGLAVETYGNINTAGCKGMATTIAAAHHSIWTVCQHTCCKKAKKVRLSLSRLTNKVTLARCGNEKSFLD